MLYDFKNIFAKNIVDKISVFDAKHCRILKKADWFLRKTPIFSQKIVIITSTPEAPFSPR
jgi:hypothetical protein